MAAVTAPLLDLKGWPTAPRRIRFVAEVRHRAEKSVPAKPLEAARLPVRDHPRLSPPLGHPIGARLLPRANGKGALAAALAVAEVRTGSRRGPRRGVRQSSRQANIPAHGQAHDRPARRPELACTRDPSLLIVDELHVVTEAVWEAVTSEKFKPTTPDPALVDQPMHIIDVPLDARQVARTVGRRHPQSWASTSPPTGPNDDRPRGTMDTSGVFPFLAA